MSQLKFVLIGLRGRGGKLNWDNVLKSASFFFGSHPEVIKGDCRHGSSDLGGHGLAEVTHKVSNIEYLGGLGQVVLIFDLKMPVVGEVQLKTSMVS